MLLECNVIGGVCLVFTCSPNQRRVFRLFVLHGHTLLLGAGLNHLEDFKAET